MLKELIYIIIAIAGFPTGIILSRMCKEEIKNWRKRFSIISIISFVLILIVTIANFQYKIPVIVALIFIIVTLLSIIWKSYRR